MRTQRSYFYKKRVKTDDDILQLFKMFEKCHGILIFTITNTISNKAAALAEAEPEPA
jgi:hypothetical protein